MLIRGCNSEDVIQRLYQWRYLIQSTKSATKCKSHTVDPGNFCVKNIHMLNFHVKNMYFIARWFRNIAHIRSFHMFNFRRFAYRGKYFNAKKFPDLQYNCSTCAMVIWRHINLVATPESCEGPPKYIIVNC